MEWKLDNYYSTLYFIIKDRALETDHRIDISSLCNGLHYMTSYLSLNSNSNLKADIEQQWKGKQMTQKEKQVYHGTSVALWPHSRDQMVVAPLSKQLLNVLRVVNNKFTLSSPANNYFLKYCGNIKTILKIQSLNIRRKKNFLNIQSVERKSLF